MNIQDRLDEAFKNPDLKIMKTRPIVFFSDLHLGGGDAADNFKPNVDIFRKALDHYFGEGFQIILVGDIEELWQFTRSDIRVLYADILTRFSGCIRLGGNHDHELDLPESLVIQGPDPILVDHGHFGDWVNDQHWKWGRWFTRYVWKPLELVGIQDPTSASKSVSRHDLVRQAHIDWAQSRGIREIYGHLHRQYQEGCSFNIGSGVTSGQIECIEYDKDLVLKTWES